MVTEQRAKVIPGVSIAALDAIADPNTRDVLRAVVEGWNLRNGDTGSGSDRFVTAAELGMDKGRSSPNFGAGAAGGVAMGTVTPPMIARIVADLQSQVLESPLFKILGERIDLVDAPGGLFDRVGASEIAIHNESVQRADADTALATSVSALGVRVGGAESATQSETTLRANSDNALAQAINFLWATVGNSTGIVQGGSTVTANTAGVVATNWTQTQSAIKDSNGNYISSAAIKTTADTAVNKAGAIEAKYTVKIDVNGYVSGYGLISSANNSTPTSDFIVRADRFSIGSPSGPGIAPQIPFIVQTTPTVVNGTPVPAGVYIDAAFIKAASITRAMIGLAEIDVLRIQGNAVTVPLVVNTVATTNGAGTGNWLTVATGSIVLDQPGMVFAASTGLIAYGTGWVATNSRLLINGSIVASGGGAEAWVNAVHSGGRQCSAGTVTVQLQFESTGPASRIVNPSLFIQAAKR